MDERTGAKRTGAADRVRDRILEAFADKAKHSGIRSVAMGDLASELRMSATTLYQHFPSKEELVSATVERWVADVAQREAAAVPRGSALTPVERLLRWAHCWAEAISQYSVAFWEDLRRRHPDAWKLFETEIGRRKKEGAARLRPLLRDDVDPEIALAVLDLVMTHMPSPRLCDRIGVSRRQSVETAIAVWARGALDPRAGSGRPKLVSLATRERTPKRKGRRGFA